MAEDMLSDYEKPLVPGRYRLVRLGSHVDGDVSCKTRPLWSGIDDSNRHMYGRTCDDVERIVSFGHSLPPTVPPREHDSNRPDQYSAPSTSTHHTIDVVHCNSDTARRRRSHWPIRGRTFHNPHSGCCQESGRATAYNVVERSARLAGAGDGAAAGGGGCLFGDVPTRQRLVGRVLDLVVDSSSYRTKNKWKSE